MQTVYLKILEGRARYNGRSTVKTRLFAVIRNTAAVSSRRGNAPSPVELTHVERGRKVRRENKKRKAADEFPRSRGILNLPRSARAREAYGTREETR
ncbi:MAG: hypothetical protein ABFS30_11440 [Pseudomonadota bacterium]